MRSNGVSTALGRNSSNFFFYLIRLEQHPKLTFFEISTFDTFLIHSEAPYVLSGRQPIVDGSRMEFSRI